MKNKFITIILGLSIVVMCSLTSCTAEDNDNTDCYLTLNFDNELVFDGKIPYGSRYDYNYYSEKNDEIDIASDIFGNWIINIKFKENEKVESGKTYKNDDLSGLSVLRRGLTYSTGRWIQDPQYPFSLRIIKNSNIEGKDFIGKFSGYVFHVTSKHYISGEFLVKVKKD